MPRGSNERWAEAFTAEVQECNKSLCRDILREELATHKALLKRCLSFVEDQVDNHTLEEDNGPMAEMDLTTASILLVDLQEVTR